MYKPKRIELNTNKIEFSYLVLNHNQFMLSKYIAVKISEFNLFGRYNDGKRL